MSELLKELQALQIKKCEEHYLLYKDKLRQAISDNPVASDYLLDFNIYDDTIGQSMYINDHKNQLMHDIMKRFQEDGIQCQQYIKSNNSCYNKVTSYIQVNLK